MRLVLYLGAEEAQDQHRRSQVGHGLDQAVGDARVPEAADEADRRGGQEIVG